MADHMRLCQCRGFLELLGDQITVGGGSLLATAHDLLDLGSLSALVGALGLLGLF